MASVQQTDSAGSCALGIIGTGSYCSGVSSNASVNKLASVGGTAGSTPITSPSQNSVDNRAIIIEWVPGSGVTGSSGTWTVRLNVTTANANLNWTATHICRVSSGCVNQETIGSLTGQSISLGTTGVKSMNVTGSAVTLGSTDKVLVMIVHTNSSGVMSQTFGWTPNQVIDSPFSAGVSGTFSKTLDAVTASAAGVLSGPVGSFAKTLADVTVAATATSTITGTAAATLDALTVVATGAAPAVGTSARTLDALTLTAAGTVVAVSVGTAAITLADMTAAATAVAPVAGAAAPTLAALLLTSAGAVPATATGASLLADLTAAASAAATISGAAALTLSALTASAAGQVPGLGAGAATLDALTMTAAGMVGATPVLGTASFTLGAITVSAQGHGPGIFFVSSSDGQGTTGVTTSALAVQAGNCLVIAIGKRPSTVTITGVTDTAGNTYTRRGPVVSNTTSPSLAVEIWTSQASCLGHAANVVTVAASGSPLKLGAVQAQYTGVGGFGVGNETTNTGGAGSNPSTSITVAAHSSYGLMATCVGGAGSFSAQFGTLREQIQTTSGPDSDNHTTLLADNTNADSVLNGLFASSAGHHADLSIELTFGIPGALAQTLGALTLTAAGTVPAEGAVGTLAATLAEATASATGKVTVSAALAATLADVTVAATATVKVAGLMATTLDPVTAVAAATVKVTGSTTKTLDAVTVVAAGSVASPATGTFSKTLAPLTLVGTITPTAGAGGALARTLDALTVTAAATTTVRGAGAATLAPLTCAATGIQFGPAHGVVAVGLDGLTLYATGTAVVPPRPPVPAAVLRGRIGVPVGPSPRHPILVGPDARRKHHLTFSGAGAVRPRLNVGLRPRAQRSILTGRH